MFCVASNVGGRSSFWVVKILLFSNELLIIGIS